MVMMTAEVFNATKKAPVANHDTYFIQSGMTLSVPAPGVLENDVGKEADSNLIVSNCKEVLPFKGTLSITGSNGGFKYVSAQGFLGKESFNCNVCDAAWPGACTESVVTVSVQKKPPAKMPTSGSDISGDTSPSVLPSASLPTKFRIFIKCDAHPEENSFLIRDLTTSKNVIDITTKQSKELTPGKVQVFERKFVAGHKYRLVVKDSKCNGFTEGKRGYVLVQASRDGKPIWAKSMWGEIGCEKSVEFVVPNLAVTNKPTEAAPKKAPLETPAPPKFRVFVQYDKYPGETKWSIKDLTTSNLIIGVSAKKSKNLPPSKLQVYEQHFDANHKYRLVVKDKKCNGFTEDKRGYVLVQASRDGKPIWAKSISGEIGCKKSKVFIVPKL